jgi:hypothetical protein
MKDQATALASGATNPGGEVGWPQITDILDRELARAKSAKVIGVRPRESTGIPSATNDDETVVLGEIESPEHFDGSSVPESWFKNLQQQETKSSEYERIISDCEAQLEAARNRKPTNYALAETGPESDPRMVWLIVWLLLIALICAAVAAQ